MPWELRRTRVSLNGHLFALVLLRSSAHEITVYECRACGARGVTEHNLRDIAPCRPDEWSPRELRERIA